MNIGDIHDCFGCGVCALACGKGIIDLRLNADGFYEPVIVAPDQCTDCGLCLDVCSYNYQDLALQKADLLSYAAWSKDDEVRRKCSSGGVSYEIGRRLLDDGYKVCGVRFNSHANRAEHYIAETLAELEQSIGSKYIQSYTLNGFKNLNRKEKYLITGTPCQIDSFRRYIQRFHCEDHFILLDFFCHGVPSKLMWDKYVRQVEEKVGKLTAVSWRSKLSGWHGSYVIGIDGAKDCDNANGILSHGRRYFSKYSKGDSFYLLFLSNSCLCKACYDKCRFKYDQSSADIRIGDLWGQTYKDDDKGVSAVLTLTKRGKQLFESSNCFLVSHPMAIVAEGQMKANPLRPAYAQKVLDSLKDANCSISHAAIYPKRERKRRLWRGRINHLFRILKIDYQINEDKNNNLS